MRYKIVIEVIITAIFRDQVNSNSCRRRQHKMHNNVEDFEREREKMKEQKWMK